MSEQENNKMEAWLKAYRQQRLDQWNEDPVELDEPTRAMLMAEVRRQKTAAPVEADTSTDDEGDSEVAAGNDETDPDGGGLPGWAIPLAIAAVVVVGAALAIRKKK